MAQRSQQYTANRISPNVFYQNLSVDGLRFSSRPDAIYVLPAGTQSVHQSDIQAI